MAKREPDKELLQALRHPMRRSLLRRLLESKEMLSTKELADLEKQPLTTVSYHIRELDKVAAIEIAGQQQICGSPQHFYLPTARVKRSPLVRAALGMRRVERRVCRPPAGLSGTG